MAANFYEAGLTFLLDKTSGVFNDQERAVLNWLRHAAEESGAIYWDQLATIPPNSAFDIIIENIKSKCRQLGLAPQFEDLQSQYKA